MDSPFDDRLAEWREYTETPWARIRYAVAERVLADQVAQLDGLLRVLDVGGGDGRDSLPLALAGHDVTIVDPAQVWLDEAERRGEAAGTRLRTLRGGLDDLPPGTWDLVLCHFVLRYRRADADDIAALAQCVGPGGRLSVMDVNPDGRVLRSLVTDGPAAAMRELQTEHVAVQTFDTIARKVTWQQTRRQAEDAGLRPVALFGNRIANDLLVDDEAKRNPAHFRELLDLELHLATTEPFNQIGFAWHHVFELRA